MERTEEEMRAYLDAIHLPPDVEDLAHHAEAWWWFEKRDYDGDEPEKRNPEPLSEEAKQAYIDEHFQICAHCGQTREWHNHNPVRDHSFEPEEKVAI